MRTKLIGLSAVLMAGLLIMGLFNYGVRWEESLEHAQILTQHVQYPEGHPLRTYVTRAPSAQTYLSSALLATTESPEVVTYLRNFLFLLATIVPVLALVTFLGGSAQYFPLAFILLGAALEFDSTYPLSVWPGAFTNGHIGMAYMLVAVAMLAGQRWRVAAFLVGAAPAIHVGQVPALLIVAAISFLWFARQATRKEIRNVSIALLAGTAFTLATFVIARQLGESLALAGPYAVNGDAHGLWQSYTFYHDTHRFFPPLNAFVGSGLTLAVTAAAVYAMKDQALKRRWPYLVALAYTTSVMGTVATAWIIHRTLGDATPFLVIGWMPYRLLNHLPFIAIAVACSLPLSRWRGTMVSTVYAWLPCSVIIVVACISRIDCVIPRQWVAQYVSHGDFIFFVLCGSTLGLLTHTGPPDGPPLYRRLLFAGLVIAIVAPYHQFGAACLVLGVLFGYLAGLGRTALVWTPTRYEDRVGTLAHTVILSIFPLVLLLSIFLRPPMAQPNFAVGEFEGAVRDYLAEVAPKAMVAAGPNAFLFQAQTGHPVFVDTTTLSLISYMPDLGPVINKMYDEVYDMPITSGPRDPDRWLTVWAERSRDEWTALTPWGFTYVAAPDSIHLDLESVVSSGGRRLYRMP